MNRNLRGLGILAALSIAIVACGPGASASPSPTEAASAAPTATPEITEAPTLTGEITLWHSYGSGGGEIGGFNNIIAAVEAANPDLDITVVEQPFDQLFNKWRTEVAAGGGPDMFIAPNDSLGQDAREGSLMNLDEWLTDNPALADFLPVSIDGSKVDVDEDGTGEFYMVPESLKAVALWYNASEIATPPTTSEELLAAVTDGSVKLGINQGPYHQFGWTGAFGGTLLNEDGSCAAADGGFAEAYAYLKDLKDAGATFNTDGAAIDNGFKTGDLTAIIDGPWTTADFRTAAEAGGFELGVVPIPAGPGGDANPFTGTDGWYINPNLDAAQAELAVNLALALTSAESQQVMVDEAGHIPANSTVAITDPITQGFADAAAAGLPRPQGPTFNNWWGPFGNALNEIVDTGADAETSIGNACTLMDEASGL
ncbi:MAG: extracellular solute-binding protein [Chloroflexota bacterium]|nr:MAG: extracellular solute-binding protein [Chloroflexota bacterium]